MQMGKRSIVFRKESSQQKGFGQKFRMSKCTQICILEYGEKLFIVGFAQAPRGQFSIVLQIALAGCPRAITLWKCVISSKSRVKQNTVRVDGVSLSSPSLYLRVCSVQKRQQARVVATVIIINTPNDLEVPSEASIGLCIPYCHNPIVEDTSSMGRVTEPCIIEQVSRIDINF